MCASKNSPVQVLKLATAGKAKLQGGDKSLVQVPFICTAELGPGVKIILSYTYQQLQVPTAGTCQAQLHPKSPVWGTDTP